MLRARLMFYAVSKGRKVGIFSTWAECQEQVKGFRDAKFKKFNSEAEALQFVSEARHNDGLSELVRADATAPYSKNTVKKLSSFLDTDLNSNRKVTIKLVSEGKYCGSNPSSEGLEKRLIDASTQTDVISFNEEKRVKALENTISLLHQQIKEFHCVEENEQIDTRGRRKKQNDLNSRKRFKIAEEKDPKIGDCGSKVHVYTDGACVNNGKCGAAAGIGIYWGSNSPYNMSARLPGRQTNNRAEIQAAVTALQQAKERNINDVVLYTDSQFLINGITKWIRGWKKNGWVLTSGEKVKNKEDFIDLDKARQGLNIEWKYVRGHTGVKGNEEADRLAVMGLKKPLP